MPSARAGVCQQPHPPRPCVGWGARPSFRDGGSLGLPSVRGASAGLGTPGRARSRDASICANTENLGRWAGCTQAGPSGRPQEVRASPRWGQEPPSPRKHRPWAGGLCPSRLPRIMTKFAPRRGSPSGPSTRPRMPGERRRPSDTGQSYPRKMFYFQVSMEMLQTMETKEKKNI